MPQQEVSEVSQSIAHIINGAKKEVIISSGKLDHRCYELPEILDAVRGAKDRKVRFFIVSGPDIDRGKSSKFISLLEDDINIGSAVPAFHFTVADGRHYRFEVADIDEDGNSQNTIGDNRVTGTYLQDRLKSVIPETRSYKVFLQELKKQEQLGKDKEKVISIS
jgi:sugar-specific transcriptional regulator TrmB